MERATSTRATQGGGSGEGFRTPITVSRTEPLQLPNIIEHIIHTNNLHHVVQSLSGTERHQVWKSEMKERIASIVARKKSLGKINGDALTMCEKLIEDWNVEPRGFRQRQNEKPSHPHRKPEHIRGMKEGGVRATFSKTTDCITNPQTCGVSSSLFINGLPRSMEKVVHLWRYGDVASGLHPTRLLAQPHLRRQLVPGYNAKQWEHSGQKRALQRHKKLVSVAVKLLNEHQSPDNNMYQVGSDSFWDSCIRLFHDKFDKNGKPAALSKILSNNTRSE